MSLPARQLTDPSLRPEPVHAPRPVVTPRPRAADAPAARPASSSPPHRRARRGAHPAFWVLSATVVIVLVLAVVALNALVVNATYRLRSVQGEQRVLAEEAAALRIDVARLSSPSRISTWAARNGMRAPMPGEVVSLRVRGGGGGAA